MADKKEPKLVLEREYNIPLRRKVSLTPKYRRAKKAIRTVREFMSRHMKSDNVLIGKYLNLLIWKHGIRNVPHHVLVIAKKFDDGKVIVEYKFAKKEQQPKQKADKAQQQQEKAASSTLPAKETALPREAEVEVHIDDADHKALANSQPGSKKGAVAGLSPEKSPSKGPGSAESKPEAKSKPKEASKSRAHVPEKSITKPAKTESKPKGN